jgi:hypothetical protein
VCAAHSFQKRAHNKHHQITQKETISLPYRGFLHITCNKLQFQRAVRNKSFTHLKVVQCLFATARYEPKGSFPLPTAGWSGVCPLQHASTSSRLTSVYQQRLHKFSKPCQNHRKLSLAQPKGKKVLQFFNLQFHQ